MEAFNLINQQQKSLKKSNNNSDLNLEKRTSIDSTTKKGDEKSKHKLSGFKKESPPIPSADNSNNEKPAFPI